MIRKLSTNLNGISLAYVMGFANAFFAALLAFGVKLNDQEVASLTALLNATLILAVHFGHRVGEATSYGSSTAHSNTAQKALDDADSA